MSTEWSTPEHVAAYLAKMHEIPHRTAGEATLCEEIDSNSRSILDLGCGNGHLLELLMHHCPAARGVGLDNSPPMLSEARQRFDGFERVQVIDHDLNDPLPFRRQAFDVVASSFAIHHCSDKRKRELYREISLVLQPGGVFCNLEHVASPTEPVHQRFLKAMNMGPEDEDPSNQLLDVDTQLQWLRELGFIDVDCYWKWRELALLVGRKVE